MLQQRPRIQPVLSRTDIALEKTGIVLLLTMCCFALYGYMHLPVIIPVHFNAMGKADDYGHKATFLLLPAISALLYWGLTALNKYPHIFNYWVTITDENALYQYTIATRMIRYIKIIILFIFSVIMIFIYLATIGKANGLSRWFLPASIGLLLLPLLYAFVNRKDKSKRLKPANDI